MSHSQEEDNFDPGQFATDGINPKLNCVTKCRLDFESGNKLEVILLDSKSTKKVSF